MDELNARKSNLRALAVAGTLSSVGAFTVLASGATSTPANAADAQSGASHTNSALIRSDDTANASSPSTRGNDDLWAQDGQGGMYFQSPQGDIYYATPQGQVYLVSPQGGGSSIGPPQAPFGQGGAGPAMSGGS